MRSLVALCLVLFGFVLGFAQREQAAFVPSRRWALVIGAGKYAEIGNLRFATRDATAFAETLKTDFLFPAESISLLTDEEGQTPPTTANVKSALDTLLADKRLKRGDLFIVYFSGHGVGTPKGDFLAPTDAKLDNIEAVGLPVREVLQTLVNAGLRNVLVIADACRGGTQNSFGKELTDLSEKSNLALMLSCLPGKRSMESPRDGHGFFTTALLKGLRDPELRDPRSGALWASKVAEFVNKEVAERTEARLGEASKQEPVSFADDRRDVMLGAFLPTAIDGEALEALKKDAATKDVDRQAGSLATYADLLYENSLFDEAAELLRVVDGLGKLDEAGRMTLGFSLQNAGRSKEGQIVLGGKFEDPLIRAVTIALNASWPSASERARAARETYALEPTFEIAFAMEQVLAEVAPLPERISFIKEALKLRMADQGTAYLQARLAHAEGRVEEAMALYRRAIDAKGIVQVEPKAVRMELFSLAASVGRFETALAVCAEGMAKEPEQGLWPLFRAQLIKGSGQSDASFALVKEALSKDLTPESILLALNVAGRRSPEIAPELGKAAARYPRSWKARLAKLLCDAFQGGIDPAKAVEAMEQAARYVDDPKILALAADSTLEPIIEEAFQAEKLSPMAYAINQLARAGTLNVLADQLGDDPEAWFALVRAHLRSFRTMIGWRATERYLGPQVKAKTLPAPLRGSYVIAALNAGEFETVNDMVGEGGFTVEDSRDAGWMRVAAHIAAGKPDLARTHVMGLKDSSPSLASPVAAMRAYLDPKSDLEAIKEDDPVATALKGMGYAERGDWAKAEPLIAQSLVGASWGFQVIHFRALNLLYQRYRTTRREPEAAELGFEAQNGFLCHPMLKGFAMAVKPNQAAFAQKLKFKGTLLNEAMQAADIVVEIEIDAAGNVKGKLDDDAEITGKCDALGNLTLQLSSDGDQFSGIGKAPAKDFPLGERTLTWILQHANGRALTFYLTRDKAQAN